ncbi:MAG: hypothetical protein AAF945_10850 [Actinomycetota bacterium]
MTDVEESAAPRAHARIVYLGPVSPHWEVYGDWGDRQVLDEFRARVLARLVLLPREDPQFRRNRERIVRDAERELISIEWDLGIPTEVQPDVAPTEVAESGAEPTAGDAADDSASDGSDATAAGSDAESVAADSSSEN